MPTPAPTEQLSRWAVAAFIVALIGVGVAPTPVPLPVLPSIVAMILASKAERHIAHSRGTRRGRSLAKWAFALGLIGIAVRVIVAMVFELGSPWHLVLFGGIAVFILLFRQGAKQDRPPTL